MIEVLPLGDDAPAADDLTTVDLDTPLAEQILGAAREVGLEQPEAIVDFAIDELDADDLLDRRPRPMSRGELQICALLLTLATPRPSLRIVDPTAGLDGRRRRVVVDLLRDLGTDRPVVVWSNDPAFG